ncbi:MAG: hypothetical protein IT282_04010 [Bacteroidetes bacterium]|nr:hypothetical protein [Bacteroidota bacterium]
MKPYALLCAAFCYAHVAFAQISSPALTAGDQFDPSVSPPAAVLGFVPGDRPARYTQVLEYSRLLAAQSPRVKLVEMGETYEHRKLQYLVFSDPMHMQNLEGIRTQNAKLSDPRAISETAAAEIAATAPAVVWVGYGIHGDEISSVDAALHVAHRLAAGTDSMTLFLLRNLVICMDPMQNPDGRERFLAQMEQWSGALQNPDAQSLHHSGTWPYGRGNHYLFDLNRDWLPLVHPETRARVQAVLQWHPQVFIDSHEMGSYDTYLFSPPREPLNPHIPANARQWWSVFAQDQARAFDRYGWSFYTREWNDDWYAGYANSWALYNDAVGILYEQAGVDGSLVKRPDGTTLHYRETVQHHIVSSLANLETAARHRRELLSRYVASRRDAMKPLPGAPRVYAWHNAANPERADLLAERLLWQGIEVHRTDRESRVRDATSAYGGTVQSVTLPAGTYLVYLDQPASRLARAILEFDPRMITSFLQEERKSLEKEKDSRLYDVTAWSLPLAYGIEAYALGTRPDVQAIAVRSIERKAGRIDGQARPYGYLLPYDDRGIGALVHLFAAGYKVRSAREPFTVEGRAYDRGALLLRANENPDSVRESLQRIAGLFGVNVHAVGTALSTKGPDLGGNDFRLLRTPRVALIGGPEINTTNFGTLWHLLDQRLRMQTTILSTSGLVTGDLRKYTVLVLPSAGAQGLERILGKSGAKRIETWIEEGGTLITVGSTSAFFADSSNRLSKVRLRHQVLKELDLFARAADLERQAGTAAIDSAALWGGTQAVDTMRVPRAGSVAEKDLAQLDERGQLFMPRGAILRVDLDEEHWLCFGAGKSVPALTFTSSAFLSRDPVRTPARYSPPSGLRLSGLLWPEARDRWAGTAYATRESKGRGQLILFAGDPTFRGFFHGTERLLLNAILLGPGWGTSGTDNE